MAYAKIYLDVFHPENNRIEIDGVRIPAKWITCHFNAGETPEVDIGIIAETVEIIAPARLVVEMPEVYDSRAFLQGNGGSTDEGSRRDS